MDGLIDILRRHLVGLALITLFIPLFCGLVGAAGLLKAWRTRWFNTGLGISTVVASGACLVLSMCLVVANPSKTLTPSIGGIGLLIDPLSLYFILLVNVIAFAASWNSIGFLEDISFDSRQQSPAFFHSLVNLFHFTMLLVPLVNNLVVLWIAIEATTLVSTLLVSFQGKTDSRKAKRDSWEAAWKYLIITSTGIIFALLGTMFLAYAAKGLIDHSVGADANRIMNWTFLLERSGDLTKDFVKLSFLFILVGYGAKAGLAPMHTWLPDGHGEAPAPISALLSGVLLKCALYAILRFYTITNAALDSTSFTSSILLGMGLLSLLIATPFILKENRFKRVLAYHSLEHMGIITFGVGVGGPVALFGALLHTLNHAVTKSLMFLSFGNVMRRYEQATRDRRLEFDQNKIRGVLQSMPVTGAILILGGLALVGTPPFNVFMSEFIILWGAFDDQQAAGASSGPPSAVPRWVIVTATALFILSTTLIFYGLVRHLSKLVLHEKPVERLKEKVLTDLGPLVFLLALVLIFGVYIFPPLSSLISDSVKIVLNNLEQ